MANTDNRNYPKPVSSNNISDDVALLQLAFDMVDGDIQALLEGLAGKASSSHSHAISHVTGLSTELNNKAASDHAHSLDDLNDVSGASVAATGYVLVKTAQGWSPSSAAAAIGNHGHAIVDITNLQTVLDDKATTLYVDSTVSNLVNSSPAHLDTLNELAAAIGDDANFATTMTNSLAGKIPKSGATLIDALFTFECDPTLDISAGVEIYKAIQIRQNTVGADAMFQLHVVGDVAVNVGLDGGLNDIAIGGWSFGSGNIYKIFHEKNSPSSLVANGYQKLATGWIIQWGYYVGGGDGTVTFPITFPTVCCSVVTNIAASSPASTALHSATVQVTSLSGFNIYTRYATHGGSVGVAGEGVYWLAIGY